MQDSKQNFENVVEVFKSQSNASPHHHAGLERETFNHVTYTLYSEEATDHDVKNRRRHYIVVLLTILSTP